MPINFNPHTVANFSKNYEILLVKWADRKGGYLINKGADEILFRTTCQYLQ